MNQSENISELAAALVKAQSQIEKLKTDEKATVQPKDGGRSFSYTYASLANVIECSRIALSSNGLAILQSVEGGPTEITIVSRLLHSSGQWMESSLTLKPTQPNVQGVGSAATYGRRYSLMALLGVAPEDDDGQAACIPPAPQQQQQKQDIPQQSGAPSAVGLKRQIRDEMTRLQLNAAQAALKTGVPGIFQLEDPEILSQVLEVLKAG